MSWWIDKDRAAFSVEIATRFELNKPDNAKGGYRWSEKSKQAASRRGGQAAVRGGAHQKKAKVA